MQFNFDCQRILETDKEGYVILEGSFIKAIKPAYLLFVNQILEAIGYASSKAQGLNTTITTANKFFTSNHRIFIKAKENSIIGFIKVGVKKLFVRDERNNYNEISPLCVLDFYVHESFQRSGHGKTIFEFMINFENTFPANLAYDRPSPKLLGFLKKHYKLASYVPQNNNYVVYSAYFENNPQRNTRSRLNSKRNINDFNNDQSKNYGNLSTNRNFSQNPYGSENPITNITHNNLASIGNNLIYNNNSANNSNNPITSLTKYPNILNNDNFYSGTIRGYSGTNPITSNNEFINNFIPKNYMNNSNIPPAANLINKLPSTEKVFSNYYLNNPEANKIDNGYSKKKTFLMKDFYSKEKPDRHEFITQQLDMRFKELDKAKDRLNHIETSVITKENNNNQFFDFKKNNEFMTLWDDKKLLAKKNSSTPIIPNNDNIDNNIFPNINVNVMSNKKNNTNNDYSYNRQNTNNYRSSAQYGAFFNNQVTQPI